jgi:hypothetical protein
MTTDERHSISVTLTPAQVDAVVRAATNSRAPSVSTLIAGALRAPLGDMARDAVGEGTPKRDRNAHDGHPASDDADPRISRSLLRGLSLLTRFSPDGAERGIVELAHELGMSPSTAYRYAFTLVELGLLERSPTTRKYRLPSGA